jgi:Zn-dependent metalloprotease
LIENGNLSVIGNNLSRGAVRNFADPSNPSDKTQIKQASHYNNRYVGTDDYGGVHVNSGIINHAAYLMDKNWTTPNHSTELATLFYKSMSYMSPNAQFIDCKNALIAAAVAMNLGDEKIAVIVNAFESVGIN